MDAKGRLKTLDLGFQMTFLFNPSGFYSINIWDNWSSVGFAREIRYPTIKIRQQSHRHSSWYLYRGQSPRYSLL